MEFGAIFSSLFRNTSRTWLVIVEVALTLAVVTNCLAMIADQRGRILRPTGLAEDEIIYVNSAQETFVDSLGIDGSALATLPESKVRPSKEALEGVMEDLR